MAESACWQLERNQVLDIAEHLHLTVEHHMTLFDIIYTMAKQILQVSAEVYADGGRVYVDQSRKVASWKSSPFVRSERGFCKAVAASAVWTADRLHRRGMLRRNLCCL